MIKLIKKNIKKLIRKYEKSKYEKALEIYRKANFNNIMILNKGFWRYLKSQEIKQ